MNNSADILPKIRTFLDTTPIEFEVMMCEPELADTAAFCEHYGIAPEQSANAILVKSKSETPTYAMCVLLAIHRLDVNRSVRKLLGSRRTSFASADETRALSDMEIGGVAPLALPESIPIWVDSNVMACDKIILGGGNRLSKLLITPHIFDHVPSAQIIEGLIKTD